MPPNVVKPTYAAQNSSARWQSRKWIVQGTETRLKLRGHSVGAAGAGSCVGSLSTASHIAFRRVALSTRQLLGGLKSCRTCGIRLVKASFYATVLHSACKR